jgi:hypothetical protein
MAPRVQIVALLAAAPALICAAFALAACRTATAPAPLDPGLASCVPSDAIALAALDLDRLRASPLYPDLPPAVHALAEPFRDSSRLLLVYNGRDLLSAARGNFREPSSGATLVARGLAVAGPPDAVLAATAQHRSGHTGAPDLLSQAGSLAPAGSALWIAARGTTSLPASGDLANVNRLLHLTEYAALAVRLDSGLALDAAGLCRTPEEARKLEEAVRGLLSLAAAMTRQPDLAALIRSVQLRREDRTVRATLSASPQAAPALIRRLSP